jgi:preprotein translocase subunit SecE
VEEVLSPLQQAQPAQGIEVSTDVAERSSGGPPKKWAAGVGGFFSRAAEFLTSARAEMKKVTWPTRDELVKATRMILILAIVMGLMIGFLDLLLQKILVDGVALLAR